MYPFGHGLSYVDFAYGPVSCKTGRKSIKLSLEVENLGDMAADEVVQVYVRRPESSIERPFKELKAFERVSLGAGEKKQVSIEIPVKELRHWDIEAEDWAIEAGPVEIFIGSSSADIRQTVSTEI